MGWWVAELWHNDRAWLVSQVFWVIFSICLHELGHGWSAIRLGDRTPILTGHMTWNPVKHMGIPSLIVFALTGYAWGAMPVDPSRMRGKYADAIVAAAGPAMNLGLAVVCTAALALWMKYAPASTPDHFEQNVRTFFFAGAVLNCVLLVLNLLPVPPLDGSRIVADFVPSFRNLISDPRAAMVGLIVIFIVFSRVGRVVADGSGRLVLDACQWAGRVLP
ncbi:MAG: site-2 protease family protein [Phycisphaerales bacterium]